MEKKKFKNRKNFGEFLKKGQKLKNGYILGSKMTKILKFALVRDFFFFFFLEKQIQFRKKIREFFKKCQKLKNGYLLDLKSTTND